MQTFYKLTIQTHSHVTPICRFNSVYMNFELIASGLRDHFTIRQRYQQ